MKHKHESHCKHTDVKYCDHCRTVYCKNCSQEWGNYNYPYYYTYTQPGTNYLNGSTGGYVPTTTSTVEPKSYTAWAADNMKLEVANGHKHE